MKTYAYLRVSTDQQDTDAQRHAILEYAHTHALGHVHITTSTASGSIPWRARELGSILDAATPADTILVTEVSRIARNTLDALEFFHHAAKRGVNVHVIKSGLRLDESIQSKITVTVLALAAEIEREFIRARTRDGMARARAAGKVLGRGGRPNTAYRLDPHRAELLRLKAAGTPLRVLGRLYDVSPQTVRAYLKRPAPQPKGA